MLNYNRGLKSLPIGLIVFLLFNVNVFSQPLLEPREGFMAGLPLHNAQPDGSGLLFYLSGSKGFKADYAAGGQLDPNFLKDVSVIPDGASGPGFKAMDDQLMSYWAPGNIYAQRGTLSFFWRSRYPVGPSPFPIFRVGYADHSSWDMCWLRIDYNGAGFDAFVTDIGLSRTRVSFYPDHFPAPDEWTHFAISWDETEGIQLYINGKQVAKKSAGNTVYDTGLDQFGPHSRIISPYQVQSAYCFMRGGDVDEIRIYDRMLSDEMVSGLAKGNVPEKLPPLNRSLSERKWRDAWWLRNGWNLPNPPPAPLPAKESSVRKVEIQDAYDIKRWYWKANDGIRETTWPGVYNMSRLPGRYDYFVLPDWDCYSGSGQSIEFTMPEEKWNHLEIWGKAWGQLTAEKEHKRDSTFSVRTQNQIKSVHRLNETHFGGKVRFDNAIIEEPIGSFDAYYVSAGKSPEGRVTESFILDNSPAEFENAALSDVASFVRGRYPADEQRMMLAYPKGEKAPLESSPLTGNSYPYIHILVPYSNKQDVGLDGIEIKFASLKVKPTHHGLFPMNIRVKDPLWPMRDLTDFSFSVSPGDAPTLWIDTRDRILPTEHALYLTISGAGSDLTSELLKGTSIKLVYKNKAAAKTEHETDRFTQVRDLYAHIVEEHPKSTRLNLYNRFTADCGDLLKVNPDHWLAQTYWYAENGTNKPAVTLPKCPENIPEWAFYQTEYLKYLERMVNWYIDKRQIANGEFGGGLSDDGDLTNMWPGLSFLGIEPEKILASLRKHMAAYYDQERPKEQASLRQRSLPLFTNGLSTIITDELHSLEDGIQVVGQMELLDYGNPLYLERGMETGLRMFNDVTQINAAGHRHFRSKFFGGTRIAKEDPWQSSVSRSFHVLHSSYLLAWYNKNPKIRQMITELADGLIAHSRDGKLFTEINFSTDEAKEDGGLAGSEKPMSLMMAAYKLTGDVKYLKFVPPKSPGYGVFDKKAIAAKYKEELTTQILNEYINTEGSVWIDRVSPFYAGIQEDRLGGIALIRTRILYPQHFVSWKFNLPSRMDDVGIFLPSPSDSLLKIIAYNLKTKPVSANLTVWDVKPGKWKVTVGIDTNDDQIIDSEETSIILYPEPGSEIPLTFAPGKNNIITMKLLSPSPVDYGLLPDLAIGSEDVKRTGNTLTVRVHNVGSSVSPATGMEIRNSEGKLIASAKVPSLKPPLDLQPSWEEVVIPLESSVNLLNATIQLDPEGKIKEITRRNSKLKL